MRVLTVIVDVVKIEVAIGCIAILPRRRHRRPRPFRRRRGAMIAIGRAVIRRVHGRGLLVCREEVTKREINRDSRFFFTRD